MAGLPGEQATARVRRRAPGDRWTTPRARFFPPIERRMSEPRSDPAARPDPEGVRGAIRAGWRALSRGHRVALVVTWLLVAFFAARGGALALRPQGNDFGIYREASRALLEGRSPLEVEGAIYLPCFAVATLPLALLPEVFGAVLWSLASLVALVVSARIVARLLARPGERAWPWLTWAPTALCLRPIDSCFANGQVNLIVFAVVMVGVAALARGRERAGASWLGLAAALKLVPALFLVDLAARRRVGAALVGATVAAALIVLAPVPWRGLRGSLDDLARWSQEVAGPFAKGGEDVHAAWPRTPGQSLTGAVYRLAVEDPARLADPDRPDAAPTPEAARRARFAVLTASALLLALLLVPLLLRPAPPGTRAWLHEMAFVVTTALLVAPLVRKAHFVWLLLPFAVLVHAATREGVPWRERRGALLVLALGAALIGGTAPALIGRQDATLLLVFAVPFWGLAVLHLGLAARVWRDALWPRA